MGTGRGGLPAGYCHPMGFMNGLLVPEASWTERFKLLLGNRSQWGDALHSDRVWLFWNCLQGQVAWWVGAPSTAWHWRGQVSAPGTRDTVCSLAHSGTLCGFLITSEDPIQWYLWNFTAFFLDLGRFGWWDKVLRIIRHQWMRFEFCSQMSGMLLSIVCSWDMLWSTCCCEGQGVDSRNFSCGEPCRFCMQENWGPGRRFICPWLGIGKPGTSWIASLQCLRVNCRCPF
jgi:hypothetical protein